MLLSIDDTQKDLSDRQKQAVIWMEKRDPKVKNLFFGYANNPNILKTIRGLSEKSVTNAVVAMGYDSPQDMWDNFDEAFQHHSTKELGLVNREALATASYVSTILDKMASDSMDPELSAWEKFTNILAMQFWTMVTAKNFPKVNLFKRSDKELLSEATCIMLFMAWADEH